MPAPAAYPLLARSLSRSSPGLQLGTIPPGSPVPQIGQKSYFCAISASPLKIKLQSTVQAQELIPTTTTDKWAHVIRVYDTPALIKGDWIFNPGGMGLERISMETCRKS